MNRTNVQEPSQLVMVMRIITVALLSGPILFLIIVLAISEDQQPQEPQQAYFAAGLAGMMIFTHFLIRLGPSRASLPESQRTGNFDPFSDEAFMALAPAYQTGLIIKLALLEGAAFYNIIAYQFERQWWSLAIVALLLLLMAVKFPTKTGIQHWIERHTMFWFD